MSNQGDQKKPEPFKGEFSFVNKDAGNLASKEHSAAVLWHVQHRYEAWKKQQLARKLRASANVPVASSGSTSGEVVSDPANPSLPFFTVPTWTGTQGLLDVQQALASNADKPSSSASGRIDPAPTEAGPTSVYLAAQTTSVTGTLGTPDTAPVVTTPVINALMTFAYKVLIPSAWPNEGQANSPSYELTRSWDDSAAAASDECYANAYFAVVASCMAKVTGNNALHLHSLTFQAKAMLAIRDRVQNQQDRRNPMTFRAILRLFTTETLAGNAAGARVHLKMLRHLITDAGGLIIIDSWFKENVLCCDTYFALRYETRPQFPAYEWTPGQLSAAWKNHMALAPNQANETLKIDATIESRALRDVFADLRELLQAHEYIATHTIAPDEPLLRWRQLRRFDCLSRIADSHVGFTIFPHLYKDPEVQVCICTAAALWACMVFGCPEPIGLGSKLMVDLRKRLTKCDEDGKLSGFYSRFQTWALYIGVTGGKTLPGLVKEKAWFEQEYERNKRERRLIDVGQVRELLNGFLYSDQLQQEVDNGVRYREVDVRQGLYTVAGCSWRAPIEDVSSPEAEGSGKGKESA